MTSTFFDTLDAQIDAQLGTVRPSRLRRFTSAVARTVVIFAVSAVLAVTTMALAGAVHVYDSPGSSGITVGDVGFEWSGPAGVGFFTCDGQC